MLESYFRARGEAEQPAPPGTPSVAALNLQQWAQRSQVTGAQHPLDRFPLIRPVQHELSAALAGLIMVCIVGVPAVLAESVSTLAHFQVVATGFEQPTGLVVYPQGDLYLTDRHAGVLYRLTSGSTAAGEPAFTSSVVIAGLDRPIGVAVEPGGHLLIAEQGRGRVVRLRKLNGVFSAVPEPVLEDLKHPQWLAASAAGALYVSAKDVKWPKGAKPKPEPNAELLLKLAADGMLSVVTDRFTRLRELIASNKGLAKRLDDLEKKYDSQFKVVFDAIRELMTPPDPTAAPLPPHKPRIGFRA